MLLNPGLDAGCPSPDELNNARVDAACPGLMLTAQGSCE